MLAGLFLCALSQMEEEVVQRGRPRGLAGADSEETVRNVELSMCGWAEGRGEMAGSLDSKFFQRERCQL